MVLCVVIALDAGTFVSLVLFGFQVVCDTKSLANGDCAVPRAQPTCEWNTAYEIGGILGRPTLKTYIVMEWCSDGR